MTEESSEQATDADIDSIVCGQSPLSNSFFSNHYGKVGWLDNHYAK